MYDRAPENPPRAEFAKNLTTLERTRRSPTTTLLRLYSARPSAYIILIK